METPRAGDKNPERGGQTPKRRGSETPREGSRDPERGVARDLRPVARDSERGGDRDLQIKGNRDSERGQDPKKGDRVKISEQRPKSEEGGQRSKEKERGSPRGKGRVWGGVGHGKMNEMMDETGPGRADCWRREKIEQMSGTPMHGYRSSNCPSLSRWECASSSDPRAVPHPGPSPRSPVQPPEGATR